MENPANETSLTQKNRFPYVSQQNSKKKPIARNTERPHQWAYNVFQEWIKLLREENTYGGEDLWSKDCDWVCSMLGKFVAEARCINGTTYTPKQSCN